MFTIGQTVTLNSGSPVMTVIAVPKHGDKALCAWFRGDDLEHSGWLDMAALKASDGPSCGTSGAT